MSCGNCVAACPKVAVTLAPGEKPVFDRELCDVCESRECVGVCYHEGLVLSCVTRTVE